jgi:hypothetical protein
MKNVDLSFKSVVLLAACSLTLQAELPEAWILYGNAQGDYDYSTDTLAGACLKSKEGVAPEGFGGLQPNAPLDLHPYWGKRIRFSANVKAEGVKDWAGLWMRVQAAHDSKNRHSSTLAYDNMQDRPITGTSGWQRYSIVLDVPGNAREVHLGILLNGTGDVCVNGVKVEPVRKNVPATGVR